MHRFDKANMLKDTCHLLVFISVKSKVDKDKKLEYISAKILSSIFQNVTK